MSSIASNDKCSGCGLCSDLCPVGAIRMEENDMGFVRPVVDSGMCIDCGLCLRKCHEHADMRKFAVRRCFTAYSEDGRIRLGSSSGGVFTELALAVLRMGGGICGAAFDPHWRLKHTFVADEDSLAPLRRSKYTESNLSEAFPEIKRYAAQGRKLLFVGTPCQCAALRMLLGRDASQIYICDFICHGVASPGLFHKMLQAIKNRAGEIRKVDFRYKITGNDSFFLIESDTDNILIPNYQYGFPYAFATALTVGGDCTDCRYASLARCSDLTLADYVGEGTDYGKSTIFVNSDRGEELLGACGPGLVLTPADMEYVQRHAWHLTRPNEPNPRRNRFFRDYATLSYDRLAERYFTPPSRWRNRVSALKKKIQSLFIR